MLRRAMMASGGIAPWTPANIATPPALWFDDESAVTDVSGYASQRNDRSGNGWHATQTASERRPLIVPAELNGKPILRAGGGDCLILPSGAENLFRSVTSGWMFGVLKKNGSDSSPASRRVFVFEVGGAGLARIGFYWDDATAGTQNKLAIGGRRLDAGSYYRAGAPSESVDTWLMALGAIDWSARTIKLYVDGSLVATTTGAFDASGATGNAASRDAAMYAAANATSSWEGDDAALLAGVALPDSGDIDRLFGYYAHRYGLQGNLPSGHPYKDAPP